MTDDELRNFVIEFRRGLLEAPSASRCFMLCAPLSALLTIHGVPNTLVETWLEGSATEPRLAAAERWPGA